MTINWERYQHTQRIAVNISASAFDNFIIAELNNPDKGRNAVNIHMLYEQVMDLFANISQIKIDANITRFNKGIDPTLTLAVYMHKQELCQETESDSGVSISRETVVPTVTNHAVATGGMEVLWRKFMRTIVLNRSWNAWKAHWNQVFQQKRKLHKLAGMPFDGMANSATEA